MGISKIEWTEQTRNPVTGCTKISAGCKNCYAEVVAKRLQAARVPGYESGFEVRLHPGRLNQPLGRKTATMYFVNSMSDFFHPEVPFHFVDKVFEVIGKTPQHIYQILTKRPERMKRYFSKRRTPGNASSARRAVAFFGCGPSASFSGTIPPGIQTRPSLRSM